MKEKNISVWYSEDNTRKAYISEDTYHYIARLYHVHPRTNKLKLYDTRLFSDRTLQYVEDTCENFINKIGEFKDIS